MKYYYIGAVPPPYGGVTIKNKLILDILQSKFSMDMVDLKLIKKLSFSEIVKFFKALLSQDSVSVIGASAKMRRLITGFLFYFNNKSMKHSLLIVMGGTFAEQIREHKLYEKWIKGYKKVYVESIGMKRELEESGASNIDVLPNFRIRPQKLPIPHNEDNGLKCLFFSQISREKGADIVLAANSLLKAPSEIKIDFYGHIAENFKIEFDTLVSQFENVEYKGVFKSDGENIYQKLNEYDLLLLPTRWKHEGVPGVIVEAKIAALPAIVSNINFNSEIVENGISGIVLDVNDPEHLAEAVLRLSCDIKLLSLMKENAQKSAEYYYADRYITSLKNQVLYDRV